MPARSAEWTTMLAASLLALCGLVGGCDTAQAPMKQPPVPGAPTAPLAPAPAPSTSAPTRPAPPKPTLASRMFVDISGSMRGFTAAGKGHLSSLHQAVDDSLASAGLALPRRCVLGADVDCAAPPRNNLAYDDASLYVAKASRLDAALRRKPVPAEIDPDHPPAPDLLDDAQVTLLLTDGMQVSGAAPADGSAEAACQAGADPACIAALLRARVQEGFGIWLVHQQLAFHGPHFAERPLDKAFFAQMQAHLRKVTLETRYNGIEFSAKGLKTDPQTGTSSYQYHGAKPLLLLVLSRDVALGRRLTGELVQRLRAQPIRPGTTEPTFATQALELAPLGSASRTLTGLVPAPKADQANLTPEQQREVRIRGTRTEGGDLSVEVWCGANGAQMLDLQYTARPSAIPAPDYVDDHLQLSGPVPATLPPRAAAKGQLRTERSAFRIGLNCPAFAPGRKVLGYELAMAPQLDESAAARAFWHELSADNQYEMPERVYGLRTLVREVLTASLGRPQRQGRVRITVEREAP